MTNEKRDKSSLSLDQSSGKISKSDDLKYVHLSAFLSDSKVKVSELVKSSKALKEKFDEERETIKIEKFDANANYIGTINPKNLNVIEFTLTNQDGEHAETGDNKTFHEAAAGNNRVILEFSIVSRHYDDFSVNNRDKIATKPI